MEEWYVLYTIPGKEDKAAGLLEQTVSYDLWSICRIPKKIKVFRSGGELHLVEDIMFPGYLFVRTGNSKGLSKELQKARTFPQFIGNTNKLLTPVENKDLQFLQSICGETLHKVMGVTKITLDDKKRIIQADGVLEHYCGQIVKLNLHKRFAIVEVELFNRRQAVLFSIRLEQDVAGEQKRFGILQ